MGTGSDCLGQCRRTGQGLLRQRSGSRAGGRSYSQGICTERQGSASRGGKGRIYIEHKRRRWRTFVARFVVAVLLVAVLLAGCGSHCKERAQEAIDDASISAAVQAKLTADRSSNFTLVSVDSDRGVLHLTGVVTSAEQRKRAEELSHQVKGVTHVENSLRIQHSNATRKFGE